MQFPTSKASRSISSLVTLLGLAAIPTYAADGTWTGATSANYSTVTNWVGSVRPGVNSATAVFNTDTATFPAGATTSGVLTSSSSYSILNVAFTDGAPIYNIQFMGNLRYFMNDGGTVSMSAGVANNETVQRVSLAPSATSVVSTNPADRFITFSNNSTSASVLSVGSASLRNEIPAATGPGTVVLSGTNTSAVNLVAGTISELAGSSALTIRKDGPSTWSLGGANAFSGGIIVNGGVLRLTNATTAAGTGNVTVNGGILSLQSTATNAISDSAILTLAGGGTPLVADTGAIELLAGTTEVVGSLVFGGATQLPGVYTAVTSPDYITGTGSITVVPEPTTCAMLAMSSVGALILRRRRAAAV